jgi:sec-independent protein translocase protein TatC
MEQEINVVEHLTELRKRLIIVIICFIVSLCAGFYVSPKILLFIKSQPAAVDIVWNVFSLTDGMFIYLKCAFIFTLLITLPVLLFTFGGLSGPG